jgi:pimeloyl-ACP methyl ester carboxylesterase
MELLRTSWEATPADAAAPAPRLPALTDAEKAGPGRTVSLADATPLQPLLGAFTGQAAPVRRVEASICANEWKGRVLTHAEVLLEAQILEEMQADSALLPYGAFSREKAPVVLVHGFADSPGEEFAALAEKLSKSGRQVFVFLYRVKTTSTEESGRQLARQLANVRDELYSPGTPLEIVAHSVGGVVTRCALNSLQEPGWRRAVEDERCSPRAGFGKVRVYAVDTPWDGFDHEPSFRPLLTALVKIGMSLAGRRGAFAMRANSEMFARLYLPKLEGVEMLNIAAREAGAPDSFRAIPDLGTNELLAVTRFITNGVPPPARTRARNAALALQQDLRFGRLQQEVIQGTRDLPPDDPLRARVLVEVYERVMPRFPGDHDSVIRDDPESSTDLFDALVKTLSR